MSILNQNLKRKWFMHEVKNMIGPLGQEVARTKGYLALTNAVFELANGRTNSNSDVEKWTMEWFCQKSRERSFFRDLYFSTPVAYKLLETFFWGVVSVISLVASADSTKPIELAKEALIICATNVACLAIAFFGMCRPEWGITLWYWMTRIIIDLSGDDVAKEVVARWTLGIEGLEKLLRNAIPSQSPEELSSVTQVFNQLMNPLAPPQSPEELSSVTQVFDQLMNPLAPSKDPSEEKEPSELSDDFQQVYEIKQ